MPKYLSLEEARRFGRLEQFAKEHPSAGDADAFEAMFQRMVEGEKPVNKRKKNWG